MRFWICSKKLSKYEFSCRINEWLYIYLVYLGFVKYVPENSFKKIESISLIILLLDPDCIKKRNSFIKNVYLILIFQENSCGSSELYTLVKNLILFLKKRILKNK
ncbi:hypothetical protein AYB34_17240 [Leptospira sp. ZV016]|nr:hypothetical protein AYB34_17240 [Leptospira sp. ZV016]KXZ29365.1 hypothetical protein AYB32_09815 [Leptospira kirschneri]